MSLENPEYLKEIFAGLGSVSVRRMFGGAGIFRESLMIALVADGELYLKADSETVPAFEAEHMRPFSYGKGKKKVVMSYWKMPERLFDDTDELAKWARAAFKAAQRSAAAKARKTSAKKKKR